MAVMMGLAMGGMALAGTAMSNRAANKQMKSDARSEGIRQAGVWFGAERKGAAIEAQLAGTNQARVDNYIEIQKSQARAESDAKVAAAAAGVAGQSVDLQVNDTRRTEAEAKHSIDKQIAQQRAQIRLDYIDNYVNAAAQIGNPEFKGVDRTARFFNTALSFTQGFMGGYSMGGSGSGGNSGGTP